MGQAIEVTECPESGQDFAGVLMLSKLAKATVGFLPDSAFRDRAERGTLLIARAGESVAGYVLYDLPRDEVRLRQLVTDPAYRKLGVARLLVDELVRRHSSRRGIVLECRRDYPVSAVWPVLRFVPIEERPGRSQDRLPLTIWYRDFGHPNLLTMTAAEFEQPIAALDSNIVIDLADGANSNAETMSANWIRNAIRTAVTDQVFLELDTQADPTVRNRHRRYASGLAKLDADLGKWEQHLDQFRSALPNPDRFDGDLRHAAMAVAGGARWLVTRDGRFSRPCRDVIRDTCGLEVVSPGEFLLAVDALVRDDSYRPADLAGSSLRIREATTADLEMLSSEFLNQREGETRSAFRAQIERIASEVPASRLTILEGGGRALGLLATRSDTVLNLIACRVHRGDSQGTIARQMLALARERCLPNNFPAVRLVDPHCGETVRRAARTEGFLPSTAGFMAMPISGIGSRALLVSIVEDIAAGLPKEWMAEEFRLIAHEPGAVTAAEDLFAPWRLLNESTPSFVISIEPGWASELFDADIARSTLFGRQPDLTLQREHVYYRNPSAAGGLTAPARILWYVKEGPSNARGLRAVSTVREVTVGDPRRLYRRFRHLGIFSEDQVLASSANGRVMAIRFGHTDMLPRPITLEEYRDLMRERNLGLNLQGPQRLPEHLFDHLLTLSHART